MKKRLSKSGETIVETLFSMLIVSLTFLFLATAIEAAARVNNKITTTQSEFHVVSSGDSQMGTIQLATGATVPVTVYRSYAGKNRAGKDVYYYYYVTRSGE